MIRHHLHVTIVTVIMITEIIVTGVLIMTDVIEVLTTIIVIGIDNGLFRCRNGPPLLPVVVSYQNRGECMKKLLITAAVMALFATPSFAADPAPAATTPEKKEVQAATPEQKFEERKAKLLKRIEVRIAKGQEAKACVEAAKNREELKACYAKVKHTRKHHHKRDQPKPEQAPAPAAPQK